MRRDGGRHDSKQEEKEKESSLVPVSVIYYAYTLEPWKAQRDVGPVGLYFTIALS